MVHPEFRREDFCRQLLNRKLEELFLPQKFPATQYVTDAIDTTYILYCTVGTILGGENVHESERIVLLSKVLSTYM